MKPIHFPKNIRTIFAVFSRRFRRKCTTLTVASFFRQFNAIRPLFCSFVQLHQLELRTSKTYSKRQNSKRPKQKHQRTDDVSHFDFFGTMRLFLKFFGFLPFDIFQHNGCQKIPKGPPFTIFGTVTLFKNLIKNILRSPKGLSLFFFSNFATNWSFSKPKGSPFYNFEP